MNQSAVAHVQRVGIIRHLPSWRSAFQATSHRHRRWALKMAGCCPLAAHGAAVQVMGVLCGAIAAAFGWLATVTDPVAAKAARVNMSNHLTFSNRR
jgi:hypothetical protein